MAGLFSDVRKTAIGAVALLCVAVLFAEPGGVGGHAVATDAASQAALAKPPRADSPAHFAQATPDDEAVRQVRAPTGAGPMINAVPAAADIPAPRPAGPDFPPGLVAPRYSSSASGP